MVNRALVFDLEFCSSDVGLLAKGGFFAMKIDIYEKKTDGSDRKKYQ